MTSGRVVFEVMHATVAALRARAEARTADVERIGRSFEWRLPVAFRAAPACVHVEGLRAVTPPWAVGLVGRVAAVEALRDRAYCEGRWRETAALRDSLARGVASALSAEIIPGVANFVPALVPPGGPSPADLVRGCRERGVFLRDFPDMPRLEARALRIAVRDASGNDRILAALREVAR